MNFRCCSGFLRHHFLIAAAFLVWTLPASSQASAPVLALQESLQKSIASLEPSLVPIVGVGEVGAMVVGTGFFVSTDGEIVTVAHVLQQGEHVAIKAMVSGSSGERQLVAVEIVAVDEPHDLALLRVRSQEASRPAYVPVTLGSSANLLPGTLVLVSGFPLASPHSNSHIGMISSSQPASDLLEIAASVNEGESGAPIVRCDNGALVGVVASVRNAPTYVGARRGVEEQNSGIALGGRSEWVVALIKRAHQKPGSR